ncbi:MAG: N-acetyl-gamma-glutamyl-phosphate reductase [Candidatus Omnitrophota bacterium]|nr:N-acetyl-gamma-glutamyl-phosphate reductase [Candidatus Omnitrophota bacterium]
MLNVGIVGASGYAGEELDKILSRHPKVNLTYLAATSAKENSRIRAFSPQEAVTLCDLLFFALPHTEAMKFIPQILATGRRIVDLGADYRLKNIAEYETWYKAKHLDKQNVMLSVYGLPEAYRKKIKKANLIANPGCYPTVVILALLPLLKKKIIGLGSIVIDAKSGLSGAGRKSVEAGLSEDLKDNFRPYKVNYHQHMPEINQELSKFSGRKISVNFVPHLLPIFRGLLATIYVKTASERAVSEERIRQLYKNFYRNEVFVRIADEGRIPQVKDVSGTNFCDIGIFYHKKNKMLVIVSAIDNLLKGAAGQAVQNMNLMYGFKETDGLI